MDSVIFFCYNVKNPVTFHGSDYSCEIQSCGAIMHISLDFILFTSKTFAITVYIFGVTVYRNILTLLIEWRRC